MMFVLVKSINIEKPEIENNEKVKKNLYIHIYTVFCLSFLFWILVLNRVK